MAGFDDNAQYIEAQKLKAEITAAMNTARSMASAMQGVTSALSQHQTGILKDVASLIQRQTQFNQQRQLKQQEMQMTELEISAAKKRLQVSRQSTQQMEDALDAAVAAGKSEETLSALREKFYTAKVKDELADQNITIRLAQVKKDQVTQLKKLPYAQIATAAADLTTAMKNITQQINKTQEQFGIAAGQAANLKVDNIVSSFNSYVESAKSLFSGKPEFGVSAEMIEGAQAAYQNEFGGILTTDAAKDLAMQARTMGVTAEQLTKARRVFTAQSLGNVAEAKKSQDKFIAEFAKKGLTSKDAMQAISQYSELLARNGTRFAQSFTRAAADAKKIGIDLTKVSQFGDNLINDFEGFLEGQAGLGAMGFNLDSNRLAQISETGSDADLFYELRSQLASTGKDITKLRRSERLELESAFGMSISEMQKLAGETPTGDTKSPEDLQVEANGLLNRLAVGIDLLTKSLGGITNVLLTAIGINTFATAFATGGMAGTLLPIAAGIATIAAFATIASSEINKGKALYRSGEKGAGITVGALGGGLMGGIAAAAALAIAGIITGLTGGAAIPIIAALAPAIMSGSILAGGAYGGYSTTKGDDVISQTGYGKRSLITPSGVIALNNKDNIIAYADDLDGTKKLPYGSIAKKAVEKYEQLDVFKKQVNDTFAQLISPSGGFGQISKFLNKDLGAVATNKVMSGKVGGAIAKAQELNAGGTGGLLSMAQGKLSGLFGGKAGGPMSSISNLFTGGGSTTSNLMGMATKIPGLGGLLGKATGLLSGGGLKGIAGGLLGKVGLGSLGGSLLGGPMGLAGSLAAPLLEKIPFVGGALASIAGGPGKLMGSALGKIGGLFGKKKAPAVSAMGAMMPEMGNVMSMLPFLSGTQSTGAQGTAQPQAPISVDTVGIEKQLNNFINALQNIQIHMDGAKVGNVLVNSNDAASSIGVFREQSR
jgi:hypothetical protein